MARKSDEERWLELTGKLIEQDKLRAKDGCYELFIWEVEKRNGRFIICASPLEKGVDHLALFA
ncbi:MAG: hypothetical protein ACFFCW_48265 [Candidatus Hodarchaeota archaeon]